MLAFEIYFRYKPKHKTIKLYQLCFDSTAIEFKPVTG